MGSNLLLYIHRALISRYLDNEDLGTDGKHVPECLPSNPLTRVASGRLQKANTGLSLKADRVASILKDMRRSGQLMTLERAQAQEYADILDTVRYSMGRAPG